MVITCQLSLAESQQLLSDRISIVLKECRQFFSKQVQKKTNKGRGSRRD